MLDTYAGLVASIKDYLEDTSPELAAAIPDMIVQAEAELRRRLRVSEQEARATATATGEYLTLPSDFGGMRAIHMEGSPDRPLEAMSSAEMLRMYAGAGAGTPHAYAIVADQLQFAPVPSSGTVEMIYYRELPALTGAANWLLTSHPDAYLIGSLLQAEFRGWNDKRLGLLKARFDEIIEQIGVETRRKQWGSAPLAPRPMPFQVRGARI